MNSSIANLYLLYKQIGANNKLVAYAETSNYYTIQAIDSVWPNAMFNFSDRILGSDLELEKISSSILEKNLPPLCMVCSDELDTVLLKNHGFYIIEQWKLMSINLSPTSAFHNWKIEACNFGVIESESDLDAWVEIVSSSLFPKKNLNKNIFKFLMSNGAELIYIRKDNKIVGTAMIYYDINEIAGIYMVSICKDQRGKGLSKQLLIYVLQQINKRGIKKAVLQSTKAGYPLYLKAGFADSGNCNLIYKIK